MSICSKRIDPNARIMSTLGMCRLLLHECSPWSIAAKWHFRIKLFFLFALKRGTSGVFLSHFWVFSKEWSVYICTFLLEGMPMPRSRNRAGTPRGPNRALWVLWALISFLAATLPILPEIWQSNGDDGTYGFGQKKKKSRISGPEKREESRLGCARSNQMYKIWSQIKVWTSTIS